MWYGWYVIAYVVLLGVLLKIHQKQWKHYASVLRDFERNVDRWLYLYTKQVALHKDSIHDYSGNVDALFSTKKTILSSKEKSYVPYLESIKKDLDYIEQLLGESLVDEDDMKKTNRLYAKLLNAKESYRVWNMILLVCTLGLYSIWQQPLLD